MPFVIQKSRCIFEIDIPAQQAEARQVTQCDSCKLAIDTTPMPKPAKGGKAPNHPSIQATLNAGNGIDTKQFHFCDETCLLAFLKKRAAKNK